MGSEQRLFAAHEDVLCGSSFFTHALRNTYSATPAKRIALPDEEPEIFSSVLEYLYKGDYFPRLRHNKRRNSWELEPATTEDTGTVESTVYHRSIEGDLLKDTVIYCAAEKYGLEDLKKLALRKQGLRERTSFHVRMFSRTNNRQNRAFNVALSSLLHVMHTQIRQTTIRSCARITSL